MNKGRQHLDILQSNIMPLRLISFSFRLSLLTLFTTFNYLRFIFNLKRLFVIRLAYSLYDKIFRHDSTISHVGFILLALSVYSIESIQAFIFYLTQYSIANLNVFITLIGILTSVVSAVYYLVIVKEIFFEKPDHKLNSELNDLILTDNVINRTGLIHKFTYTADDIKLSSSNTIIISILTLIVSLFIFVPQE